MRKIISLREEGMMKNAVRTYSGRMAALKEFRNYFDCTIEKGFEEGRMEDIEKS